MYFEIHQDEKGEWRWTLRAPNGNRIALSAYGCESAADCQKGIRIVKDTDINTTVKLRTSGDQLLGNAPTVSARN